MKGVPPFTRHPAGIDYLTPYAAGLAPAFRKGAHRPLIREGAIRIIRAGGGVWASLKWTAGSLINLRLFEEPNGLTTVRARVSKGHLRIKATGALGTYSATVEPSASDANVCIRCTVTATLRSAGNFEGQDRDVLLTDRKFNCLPTGLYFTSQTGPAAGQAFVGLDTATLLYFQNLSALARYSGLTESSLVSCVGVEWPRLGLKLPTGPRAVPAGKPIVLSDVFLRINTAGGTSEAERSLAFIEALAEIHRRIEVPLVGWRDWSSIASRTIRDLGRSKQCSRKIAGATYLNAYVASDDKPPESMVQAAVLVPLAEYEKWAGKEVPLVTLLTSNIPSFYLGKLCTFTRWLPGKRFAKKETSEEEAAEKMDSWYLLHSLMNIGRLAELGKLSNELFLGCLAYIIKVARHFDYDWPVFYNRRTLRVYKRETAVGAGGEQDAAGLYAHVMMQAWRMTNDETYLREAEIAAGRLQGLGFGVLYQTNNTTFSAVALAWLWQATGNTLYKELSYVCMGSILSHLWLWEPARNNAELRTYMGLPPLHDAPYIAAYEEGEVFAAFDAYMNALGTEMPASLESILVEYGKHLLHRAHFYFPSELPRDAICGKPREGVIDRTLMMPVEDLYPSDDLIGQVGQEVYGAALGMILCTRSIHRWQKVPFLLWCDAPAMAEFSLGEKRGSGRLELALRGMPAHQYSLRLIPPKGRRQKFFRIHKSGKDGRASKVPLEAAGGGWEFKAPGGSRLSIEWRAATEEETRNITKKRLARHKRKN